MQWKAFPCCFPCSPAGAGHQPGLSPVTSSSSSTRHWAPPAGLHPTLKPLGVLPCHPHSSEEKQENLNFKQWRWEMYTSCLCSRAPTVEREHLLKIWAEQWLQNTNGLDYARGLWAILLKTKRVNLLTSFFWALWEAANGLLSVPHQEPCQGIRCGTEKLGWVGMVGMGGWLDLVILVVFSNLNVSMIWAASASQEQSSHFVFPLSRIKIKFN